MPAASQEADFHWAYAAFFGTGRYQLDEFAETTVIGFAPAWTWREAALSETGQRTIGYRFLVPMSLGSTEFELFETLSASRLDSVTAFSAVPGVEVEIPLTARLSIKPQGFIGYGVEPGGGASARIFRLGFSSQLTFQPRDIELHLVNAIERIGYSASTDTSDAINLVHTGLEFGRVLKEAKIRQTPVRLNWHVMYTTYLDSIGFALRGFELQPEPVGSEWELGISFGKSDGPLRLWRLKFDVVGIAYRFDSDSHFTGVGIVFKSLFDR